MFRTDKQFMKNPATAGSRIYVGSLPRTIIADDLDQKFNVHGKILGLSLQSGFAFIQFENDNDAQRAIEREHNTLIQGRKINVRPALGRNQPLPGKSAPPQQNQNNQRFNQPPPNNNMNNPPPNMNNPPPNINKPPPQTPPKESNPPAAPLLATPEAPVVDKMDEEEFQEEVTPGNENWDNQNEDQDNKTPRNDNWESKNDNRDSKPGRNDSWDNKNDNRDNRGPRNDNWDNKNSRIDNKNNRNDNWDNKNNRNDNWDNKNSRNDNWDKNRDNRDGNRGSWGGRGGRGGGNNRFDRNDNFNHGDKFNRDHPGDKFNRDHGGNKFGDKFNRDFPRDNFDMAPPAYDAPEPVPERNDCEIIVVSKALTEYAEFIEQRLKSQGLIVDLLFPNEDVPIGRVLANISSRGCLYAILVMPQNEEHRSLTLNILHGTPQEHRNMPIEDAEILISRNFEAYMRGDKTFDKPGEMSLLDRHPMPIQMSLNLLAENRQLTSVQYDKIIKYLQDRRELQHQYELSEGIELESEDANNKQAELQNRIMNILNKPNEAPIPISITAPEPVEQTGSTPILNDPTVQKALDSLFLGDMLKNIA